jgi:hypothetical protein
MAVTRDELVAKLVCVGHLNVEERRGLGGSVTRDEVAATIERVLVAHEHFPPNARPWAPGTACFEGWQLLRAVGGYRLLAQRHPPTNPMQCAESRFEDFATANAAIDQYIKRAVGSDIDGVPVRATTTP